MHLFGTYSLLYHPQARVAIRNMFLGDKNKQSDLLIPWCTYTEPEVAHVGKYEAELKEAGVEFESYMVGVMVCVRVSFSFGR